MIRLFTIALSIFVITSCDSNTRKYLPDMIPDQINPPDWIPPVFGGFLAGAACYSFFKGRTRIVATAICAAGGAWVGKALHDYLKPKEQAQLADATYQTLETGKKQTVKTEEGTTITTILATPKADKPRRAPAAPTSKPASPQPPAPVTPESTVAAAPSQECGTVTQTIVTSDNQRFQDTISACKKDGVWVAA